uniref:Tr-type G domain-containing protein n=1 Tax=Mesocestoides corti TaxID=53468 RepID=A0A5K3FTK4_MESCO
MHKQINFDPDSQQKLNVSSSSSHVKHVSALASFFSYKLNRVIVPQHTQHFIDLMITLRRCRPSLFLHYPPPSKCPQSFRFDTPAPVLFDSTIEVSAVTKRSDGLPRPRTRATHPKHGKDRVVDGASESVTTVLSHLDLVDPVLDEKTHTNIASKAPSEARIPSVPNKPIDRTPLLNAYEEKVKSGKEKDTINLLVVGHVDAGKSTLMGNVLYQLGQVSEKQIAKYQWEAQKIGKASFAYAWVLDQTTEERNRGITMDIAQTAFETPTKRLFKVICRYQVTEVQAFFCMHRYIRVEVPCD